MDERQLKSPLIKNIFKNREHIITSLDSIFNSFDKIDALFKRKEKNILKKQLVVVDQTFINQIEKPQTVGNIFDSKLCDSTSIPQLSQLLKIGTKILVNISSFDLLFDNEDLLNKNDPGDNYRSSEVWVKAVIQNILYGDNEIFKNYNTHYALTYTVKVIDADFLKLNYVASGLTFKVNSNNIAVTLKSRFLYNLPIGSRIVVKHPHIRNNSEQATTNFTNFELYQLKSGSILEPICARNSYRYLIMFNDWTCLYLDPTLGGNGDHGKSIINLNYVNSTTTMANTNHSNTGETLNQQPSTSSKSEELKAVKAFINNYLKRYPERQLVHLKEGQMVNLLLRDGAMKWISALVTETDCSLVKLKVGPFSTTAHNVSHNNTEFWIYRGSFRLEPIFKELMRHHTSATLNRRRHSHHYANRITKDVPYIEYNFISPLPTITTSDQLQQQTISPHPKCEQSSQQQLTHNLTNKIIDVEKESNPEEEEENCRDIILIDDSPIIAENDDDTPLVLNTIAPSKSTTVVRKTGATAVSACTNIFEILSDHQHKINTGNNDDSYSSIEQSSLSSCKKVLEDTKSYNLVRCDTMCRPALLAKERTAYEVRFRLDHYNAFAKPLYAGWDRFCVTESGEIYGGRINNGLNKTTRCSTRIVYLSPTCDNSSHKRSVITNAKNIVNYLVTTIGTHSRFTVDCFSFDTRVSPNLKPLSSLVPGKVSTMPPYEPSLNGTYLVSWDISEGKEVPPISCVLDPDYVDKIPTKTALMSERPAHFLYDSKRTPAPGIVMNKEDASFLVGCTCTDGFCGDPNTCSCRSLTISSFKQDENNSDLDSTDEYEGSVPADESPAGSNLNRQNHPGREYNFKQLPRKIVSGIYECNINCPCHRKHCLNRVVQNGLGGARMQIFKDEYKGWCGRTLDDIPKGAFVSTYAGYILSEDMSDMIGKSQNADEYFADLDFIECAEQQSDSDSDDSYIPDESLKPANIKHSNDNLSNQRHKFRRKNKNIFETEIFADLMQSPGKNQDKSIDIIDLEDGTTNNDSDDIGIIHEINVKSRNNRTTKVTQNENIFQKLLLKLTLPMSSYENNDFSNHNNSNNAHNDRINETSSNLQLTNTTRFWCSNQNGVFVLDAKRRGNIGRFFSHSCDPNMYIQNVFVDTHNLCFPWICFFASRTIKAGEELTWDYCYEINSTGKTIICMCMSENCRGRLL